MTDSEIRALLERQRTFYKTGATIPVQFRIAQLKKLYAAVKKYENEINAALTADLGKSAFFALSSHLNHVSLSTFLLHPQLVDRASCGAPPEKPANAAP